MEIISSKQEVEIKATNFIINISKLFTNSKVLIRGFVWSLVILIANVLAVTYSFYFDYLFSMSIPFKRYIFFVKIQWIIAELSALKVEQYPIHLQ